MVITQGQNIKNGSQEGHRNVWISNGSRCNNTRSFAFLQARLMNFFFFLPGAQDHFYGPLLWSPPTGLVALAICLGASGSLPKLLHQKLFVDHPKQKPFLFMPYSRFEAVQFHVWNDHLTFFGHFVLSCSCQRDTLLCSIFMSSCPPLAF